MAQKTATDMLIQVNNSGLYDLQIQNGDLVIGNSDPQNCELIMYSNPGAFKFNPSTGVGLRGYLASSNQALALERAITIQLTADGFKVDAVEAVVDNLEWIVSIAAHRINLV